MYSEEGLSVRRQRGRKRATGTREPMPVSDGPGQRWSLDFLSVIDDHTRECLALAADTSIPSQRVVRGLDAVVRLYGKPLSIVSDNGSELTGRAMLAWQNQADVTWHYIAPDKPQQNAFIESFTGASAMNC